MKAWHCVVLLAFIGNVLAADEAQDAPDDSRIVGGFRAPEGSAPWQAELYSIHDKTAAEIDADRALPNSDPNKRFFAEKPKWELAHRCGGAYIGDMWVVTAAHCFNDVAEPLKDRRVRLGTQDLSIGGATYRIERVVIHMGYDRRTKQHDIALARIAPDAGSPAAITAGLVPIRILGDKPTDRPLADHDRVSVTGWGLTGGRDATSRGSLDREGKVLHASAALMQVDLSNLPQSQCEAQYSGFLGAGVICAGSSTPGKDSCTGDSGGPLTRAQGRNERVLVGVVSWGKGCALPGVPGIYTNVPHHRSWIEAARKSAAPGKVSRL